MWFLCLLTTIRAAYNHLILASLGHSKQLWTSFVCDWVRMNPSRTKSTHNIPSIVAKAIEMSITEMNVKSSLRAAGIRPLDTQVFQDINCLPSATTDRSYVSKNTGDESTFLNAEISNKSIFLPIINE